MGLYLLASAITCVGSQLLYRAFGRKVNPAFAHTNIEENIRRIAVDFKP